MILFINPISENIRIFHVGDISLRLLSEIPKNHDYDAFPEEIVRHVEQNVEVGEIHQIWCIYGPGSFTRMRIVTLALNTLSLSKNVVLKGCHFFELIDSQYTPLLEINACEYLTRTEWIIPWETLLQISWQTYSGYISKNNFTENINFIEYLEEYEKIREVFKKKTYTKRLIPIYLKEPHITWSKKNTFLS